MATTAKKRRTTTKKTNSETHYRRRTFMFDDDTEKEASAVKRAIRATTASEAVRYAVRKVHELMVHIKGGGRVYVDTKAKGTVALDIPPAP